MSISDVNETLQSASQAVPRKDRYYLGIAKAVSMKSTCLRVHYGAIIVKDDRIVSTGYNGSAAGFINCSDASFCLRAKLKVPHGERYELCRSVHAEANAIIRGTAAEMKGATLYLYGWENDPDTPMEDYAPCFMCERMIVNAGITDVVTMLCDGTAKHIPTQTYQSRDTLGLNEMMKLASMEGETDHPKPDHDSDERFKYAHI